MKTCTFDFKFLVNVLAVYFANLGDDENLHIFKFSQINELVKSKAAAPAAVFKILEWAQ